MIIEALHSKLASDPSLVALLADYLSEPAIFTTDPAPDDATLPYLVVSVIPVQNSFDTKTSMGKEVWADISCFADRSGSSDEIRLIAEKVYYDLHRQPLLIPGYLWIMTECSGPLSADEDKVYGRIVTAKVTMERI